MQIIPTIYLKDKKVAAYTPGNYRDLSYLSYDPYELINKLEEFNIDRIIIIDIDAAIPGETNNSNKGLLGSLSNTTVIDIEVGGGINSMEYLKSLQYAGVDYFVLGSVVIDNFDFLREICEAEDIRNDRIVIAADVNRGQLTYHGWKDKVPDLTLEQLIYKCINTGFNRFIVSEISDIEEQYGPDVNFYKGLVEEFSGQVIAAAGNIHHIDHILALEEAGVKEVLVGEKIYHEDELLQKIAEYNKKHKEDH